MIRGVGTMVDLLERPTYGLAQVDRVLGLKNGTAQRWVDGYDRGGKHYEPLIRESTTGQSIVTWGEFIEARLLAEYRDAGVRIFRMRPAIEELRQELGTKYPLASARMWLGTSGRELVRQVQDDVGLTDELAIVVVRSNQYVHPGVLESEPIQWAPKARAFRESLVWSEGEGERVPEKVRPMAGNRIVEIDPRRGFGEPVVRNVQTGIIAELVRAGDSPEMVAELYDLSIDQVNAAIRYELTRVPA
jgi:uncharacterized protein (DUF433 family)